jgi:transposase
VDETGTNTAMTARYARALRGQRAHGRAPRNYGPNVTLVAAMRLGGMGPAMVLDGALTTEAFEAYVAQQLVPWLHPGDVVILDNLAAHTSGATRQVIESAGGVLHFLPAYSPDFNPIEGGMSKLKTGLRRARARSREALITAIAEGLTAITMHDIHGWFHGCGYVLARQ